MLTVLLPVAEPGVLTGAAATPRDALGNALPPFALTAAAAAMILVSAVLGLLVTLSTFLVIGHTSALTYNVVGHVKTVSIITGGVLLYGEVRPRSPRLLRRYRSRRLRAARPRT